MMKSPGEQTFGESQVTDLQKANQFLEKALQEERQAASALRAQADQLQQFFDVAKVGTWRWNIHTGEVLTNARMRVLYGLDPNQLTSHIDEYYAVIYPDDRETVRIALEEALATGGSYTAEYRIVKSDGVTHWISARGAVQVDVVGQPIAILGINSDIDERKRAEMALQESEHQFKTLADSIPQQAWMADSDGSISWYNSRWYEYTGTTHEQMQGWGWQSVHDPAQLPAVLERWRASIASGERFEMEMPIRGRDGLFRWFLTRGTPVRDSQERVVRWFGTNTDVTDIRQAREALRESEQQLRQLADTMPQLVSVTTADGLVQWWNQRWYAYSGMTPERSAGNGWAVAMHPEDIEATRQGWEQSLATGTPFETEYRWRRHDGVYRWFLCRALPVRDASGEIVKWLATSTDVEDYKRATAEIRSLNEGLQERNEQLLTQTQRAEQANRAKSAFLAVMSHEIRTPMNAILGMSDLLWESTLDCDQRRYVEVFRRAGNTLLSLINDILDLSKIEAGHLELEHAPFDIEGLAERSLELVAPRAKAKGIPLLCRIAPDVPRSFIGDASRLQQVLVNLLGNAVKFTEKGEVVLNIERQPKGRAGSLAISVKDSGIGIPADKHAAIFEDFEQADKSTTRQYGGTGLGLGICKRLVKLMGGDISLESTVGAGSTFRFTAALTPDETGNPTPQTELPDLRGRRVLIIDNNSTNRMIIRETLASWGLESVECETVRAGMRAMEQAQLQNSSFDMAMIDSQMPDENGFVAAKLLRTMRPGIPLVMLSSDDRPGDGAKRRELGLSGFATKPVRRADLLRLVGKALGTALEESAQASSGDKGPVTRGEEEPVLRILIAEDSPDNRMLFEAYLKLSGHSLIFAENGREAVELFESQAYDLIIMDMLMPLMDGLDATRGIRSIEHNQGRTPVPIVAVTANASAHDAAASKAAGCNAHLAKPISKARLLDALAEHRKVRKVPQSLSPVQVNAPAGLEKLVPRYLDARKKELPILRQALLSEDFDCIRKLGHNMKGTGTSYGFSELTRMGAALESSAKQAALSQLTHEVGELEQYIGRILITMT